MGHLDSATALDAVPQPYLDDGDVQLYHGDVTATLRALPAGIAQTCVTSPPYWGLRDYGTGEWTGGDATCDHDAAKVKTRYDYSLTSSPIQDGTRTGTDGGQYHRDCPSCGARRVDSQLGLEATPTLYVERMVAVFREVWRVLRDDGTCWINLGDSYNANQGAGFNGQKRQDHANRHTVMARPEGVKPKDLVGIPWMVAFALRADGWYLRSDIVWSKPNPMPESVVDRPTKAHEYLFLLAKRPRYFYDADAIRDPHAGLPSGNVNGKPNPAAALGQGDTRHSIPWEPAAAGRNRRSVWTIPTEPFPEAHFATYPQALVRPCIQAGTSEHGECSACGAPWVRISEREFVKTRGDAHSTDRYDKYDAGSNYPHSLGGYGRYDVTTTGWRASCTCDAPTRPQLVLDPFIGSGTTALVARNHGRRCIGIDLSAEYLNIAAKRLQQLSLLGGTT